MNKPIKKSKTVWGLAVALICGLLAAFDITITDSESEAVAQALGVVAGFAFGLYGRIVARVGIKRPENADKDYLSSATRLLLFGFCIFPALALQPGCNALENMSTDSRALLTAAAKTAMLIGVAELSDKVPEVQPFRSALEHSIQIAFNDAADPGDAGRIIRQSVLAKVPPEWQPLVIQTLQSALLPDAEPGTTASSFEQASYNAAVAAQL